MNNTNIPVMGHADGICHVYVDRGADLDKAVRISVDAKTQYVAVCNAVDTLLVHADIAGRFLARALYELAGKGVTIRGDERTLELAGAGGAVTPATEADWSTEYLDLVLSVKVVDSAARGDRSHQRIRQPPHRRHRHRGRRGRQPVPAQRRLGLGPAQRLHPASPTASATAWGPRSGSAPGGCTAAARSGWKG